MAHQVSSREEAFQVAGKLQVLHQQPACLEGMKSLVEIGALMESMHNLDISNVETVIPDAYCAYQLGLRT
ncbi:hypothetical protein H6G91_26325 [Nostoc muscorum FACHB-395]|nr:hypothetical protein [Desmonostoc muscorum FACHB-395]